MYRILAVLLLALLVSPVHAVRLKELSRIDGDREYRLVGYGLVVGLAGSGDSDRNRGTRLSLANALSHFQVTLKESEIVSRNTAAVIVTASASAYREPGDRIDVQVSSLGDARSLQGGTLILTPLYGADQVLYALAQGALSTGSYHYELNATSVQKNHPTVGVVPRGATLERPFLGNLVPQGEAEQTRHVALVLDQPDMTTAVRIVNALRTVPELDEIKVSHAGKITFAVPATGETNANQLPALLARIENLDIVPDQPARLVINERTGTLVAGGDIVLGQAVIAHDDLRIEINTGFSVSQPASQLLPGSSIATVVVPETFISLRESYSPAVIPVPQNATVLDLVNTLRKAGVQTKSMIPIFQSLREAGALHAHIVVQ